jgi:spermidine/putrescine transport system substrate-binding protein
MKRIQFIDRMAQGKISRRQMLSSAGAFGVGLLSLPKFSAAAEVLTCMEWGGYDAAEYFKPYVDKHGGAPNFSIFSGEEDALAKVLRKLIRRNFRTGRTSSPRCKPPKELSLTAR